MIDLEIKEIEQPTTKDLLDFASTFGLVEEKENFILLTLSAINKVSCGVESVSGSGKSVMTDIAMLLIPKEKVYNLGLTSNTATIYDYEAVNNAEIIYVEELQKALNSNNPIIIELLKNVTEGKKISRKVYDSMERKNRTQTIKGGLGLVYSLALENRMKKDDEMDRRVITFTTDISQEQNRKVVKYLGKRRFKKSRLKFQEDDRTNELRNHIKEVMALKGVEVENPFAEYISKMVPVPFVKVRSHINHYFNLMDSSAKFHYKSRLRKDGKLFVSLQDVYNIHNLYGKMFNQKVHNLPHLGGKIMKVFDKKDEGWVKNAEKLQQMLFIDKDGEEKLYFDITKIHKILKENGLLIKYKIIKDQCDDLVEAGFLGKEMNGKRDVYFKTDDVEEFEDNFNFQECMIEAMKNMKEHYEEYSLEWAEMQMSDDLQFKVYDPIDGTEHKIKNMVPKEKPKKKKEVEETIKQGKAELVEEEIE